MFPIPLVWFVSSGDIRNITELLLFQWQFLLKCLERCGYGFATRGWNRLLAETTGTETHPLIPTTFEDKQK
jgi:hypothetical protein